MNCKNCNHIIEKNFCPNCGQNTKVDRVNIQSFFRELSDSVFQVNKGLFYTIKELFVSPGQSIRGFLNGQRKYHFKPIAYVFTLSTIYFIISRYAENATFLDNFIEGYSNAAKDSKKDTINIEALKWFSRNYAYTALMLLPFYSLGSYIAFFRKKYNYLEHFVLNSYLLGQQTIIYIIASILSLYIDNSDRLNSLAFIASIVYAFIVFWKFFSDESRLRVFFRTVLTYVLYFVLISLITFLVFAASAMLQAV